MRGHDLAMALRAAYLAMHRRTDRLAAESGVTADQFVVLAALARGDALTQRELAARTSTDPNTLRPMLVILERKGLVERRPHSTDGRARSVALTAAGASVLKTLMRRTEPLRKRMLAALGPAVGPTFLANLGRLTAALDGDDAEITEAQRRPR